MIIFNSYVKLPEGREFRACSNHQELQKRLIEPEDDEEAARRATLAKQRLGDGSAVVWM